MKFRLIENELHISVEGLAAAKVESDSIKKGLYRNRALGRDSWTHREDEYDARRVWILVDSIPERTMPQLRRHYGEDLLAVYHQESLEGEAIEKIQADDAGWFLALNVYSVEQAADLAEACGWLRLVSTPRWWEGRWSAKTAAMRAAAGVIATKNLHGFRVSNWRVLNRRAKAWLQDGRNSLVSSKIGNKNAAKATGNIRRLIEARIIDLYASPLKPTAETVAEIYNREAAANAWPQYTAERVRQLLNKPLNVQKWTAARHGVNAARARTETVLRRRRPAGPDVLWSIDGTTVQLFSSDGKTLVKEWYAITIIDAYSDCVIGWACAASTETARLVLRAMRSAIQRRGTRPAFAQFDGSKANLSTEVQQVFERMKTVGIRSQPYNGKSKYVERVQGWIEQHFQRYMPNFVGGNITARSLDTRANPDYLQKLRKAGHIPGTDQIPKQFELAIETYNNTTIKARKATPAELYAQESLGAQVDYLTQVSIFWVKRRRTVRYTPEGIRMEVDKQRYFYEVQSKPGLEDYDFRREYLGDSFIVRYDPDDLTEINLYDRDDKWIATAKEKHEFGSVPGEWVEDEGSTLNEALKQRKRYIDEGLEEREQIREEMERMGHAEVSFESVHKDALNKMEGDFVTRMLEASAVEKPAPRPMTGRRRPLYYDENIADKYLSDDENNESNHEYEDEEGF